MLSSRQKNWPRQGTLQGSKLAAVSRAGKDQFPVLLTPSSQCFNLPHFSCFLPFPVEFQYPGTYLTFELVSFVPYDRNLIDVSLLSPEQVSVLSTAYSSPYEALTSNHPRPFLPLFPLAQGLLPFTRKIHIVVP